MAAESGAVAEGSALHTRGELASAFANFASRGYAVVDGGHFPDLPKTFRRERLFARSLFLARADADVRAAGPFLVSIGQMPDALDRILSIVEDKPAAVFWRCGAGEATLFHHLRGLNVARIPLWAARGGDRPPTLRIVPEPTDVVMFRHWDPTVLDALLPGLGTAQFSRVVGPADEIAFVAGAGAKRVRRVLREAAWPPPPAGPLTIDNTQMLAMAERRRAASRRRIAAEVRGVAAWSDSDDATVADFVARCEAQGQSYGLRSERDLGNWALFAATHEGWEEHQSGVDEFMRTGRTSRTNAMTTSLDTTFSKGRLL